MRLSVDSTDIRQIDICDIDCNDTDFRITTDNRSRAIPDDLFESIRNVGLLTPPVLFQRPGTPEPGKSFSIVCGFRRIAACIRLGSPTIAARVMPADSNGLALTQLSIADNTSIRELNVVEQALAAAKLSGFVSDSTLLCREAATAGLILNPGLLAKLIKINAAFDELKDLLAADIIPLSIGLELATLEKPDALGLSRLFEKLNPTLNHQKEIIRLAKEIARLKGCGVGDILDDDPVRAIVLDTDMDRNRKIKRLRACLRQMRYPEIVRFEEQFLDHLTWLHLPDTIRLIPPAEFEGTVFSIQGRFTCREEFETMMQALDRLHGHPAFNRILDKNFENH